MSSQKRIRTLLFSTLFPSSVRPGHGIFVETRLRELLSSGQIETKVVAPIPWFFSRDSRFGEYGRMAATPARETYHGVDVLHPRYALLPKVGMTLAPIMLALGAMPAIKKLLDEGFDFDVIDAHYYYPDGVAAAMLARYFGKPFVVTARGTDLNLIPKYPLPRMMMKWAAKQAAVSIGVCSALVDVLREWKIPEGKLRVMRNGVDLIRFAPLNPSEARTALGLTGAPLLLTVGHLIERKGHRYAIEALAKLIDVYPEAKLVIIGEGEEHSALITLSQQLGLTDHVKFAGALPNADLFRWYSAADALILASSREGWANVLLESMACGTPVIATRIWGTPEVIASEVAGRLVDHRTGIAFADAVVSLMQNYPDRSRVRAYAEQFSWQNTTDAQVAMFRQIADQGH